MRRQLAAAAFSSVLCMSMAQGAQIEVCYNYGCLNVQAVTYAPEQVRALRTEMAKATDAASEREHLPRVIALMYRWAGEQSPIGADRAGDYLDDGVDGRMDCIDHANTTTRMLELLQREGALHHHRVAGIARRNSWLIMQHFSAVIEEIESGGRHVVDTWFRDHAEPAVVMEMQQWKDGGYPDDATADR